MLIAEHVAEDFATELDLMILNGGRSEFGLESTVLDLTTARPTLLRPGTVTLESLRQILGDVDAPEVHEQGASPGTAARSARVAPDPSHGPSTRDPTSGVISDGAFAARDTTWLRSMACRCGIARSFTVAAIGIHAEPRHL